METPCRIIQGSSASPTPIVRGSAFPCPSRLTGRTTHILRQWSASRSCCPPRWRGPMPLIHSASKKAREENIKRKIAAGRDPKQAVAIGYSEQRRNEGKKK